MTAFVRLRSEYSFRTAIGTLQELQELTADWEFHPLTDRASAFGWRKWQDTAKNPVFGLELEVTPDATERRPVSVPWIFLARNVEPLAKALEFATAQQRYRPLLTVQQAAEFAGDVIVGEGTPPDWLPEGAFRYFALSPTAQHGWIAAMLEHGLRPAAAQDNLYALPSQRALYEVIAGRNKLTRIAPGHIMQLDEWRRWIQRPDLIEEALKNARLLLASNKFSLQQAQLAEPADRFNLHERCLEGAKRLGIDLQQPEYAERLERELELIRQKGFEDYFRIIAGITDWARQRMLVGPARGSSAGSLVAYLLGITTVDPLQHGLVFERFIDINRNDLPDIDIDFNDLRRGEVFDYIRRTYGPERVARLGTVNEYKPRSALREAAGALDIEPYKLAPVLDAIIERSSGDARAKQCVIDTLTGTSAGQKLLEQHPEIRLAADMEGRARHAGQHAAGIVLTDRPIDAYIPIDARTGAVHCDKHDAEALGLLKIDALGLTQLSVLEEALALAGLPHDYLFSVPLNDPAAFEVFNRRHFTGIFQFNGKALRSLSNEITFTEFEDIVSLTALARPGPLHSGSAREWIERKTGKKPITYPHPIFEPYTRDTFGIIVYQEQIMRIGREIGGLSWEDVTALRKAMSKSLGKEYFDQFGDRWKAGAIKKGVPQDVADEVWNAMCAYGSWAFNKSHSVSYGIISYWCAWMKAHYPLQYAAAMLSHETDEMRQIELLRELVEEGIEYVPVDPAISTDRWQIRDDKLIGPLTLVKGIGPKLAEQIMLARRLNQPLPTKAQKLLAAPKTALDDLWPITHAIKRACPDLRERNILTDPTPIGELLDPSSADKTVVVIGVLTEIMPHDENEPMQIAKRGYKLKGPTQALYLRIKDDTGEIRGKIDRFKYPRIGKPIFEHGRPGSAIWAIKGRRLRDFAFLVIENARYIGEL